VSPDKKDWIIGGEFFFITFVGRDDRQPPDQGGCDSLPASHSRAVGRAANRAVSR
jgi:hypothetical protein